MDYCDGTILLYEPKNKDNERKNNSILAKINKKLEMMSNY